MSDTLLTILFLADMLIAPLLAALCASIRDKRIRENTIMLVVILALFAMHHITRAGGQ